MKNIKKILMQHATGKKVLALFILTNLVYLAMLLFTMPATMEFARGMKILDMMPLGYNAAYVEALFAALGDEGRNYYLYRQLPVDFLYPLLFGISYSLLLAFFLKKLNRMDGWYLLCILPIIAGIADYAENFGIINLLRAYPEISGVTVDLTGIFSVVKSSLSTIYFLSLIMVLVLLGIKRLSKKMATFKVQGKLK